jgi:hypothetical protein
MRVDAEADDEALEVEQEVDSLQHLDRLLGSQRSRSSIRMRIRPTTFSGCSLSQALLERLEIVLISSMCAIWPP